MLGLPKAETGCGSLVSVEDDLANEENGFDEAPLIEPNPEEPKVILDGLALPAAPNALGNFSLLLMELKDGILLSVLPNAVAVTTF